MSCGTPCWDAFRSSLQQPGETVRSQVLESLVCWLAPTDCHAGTHTSQLCPAPYCAAMFMWHCLAVLFCSCLQQPGETVRSQVLESLGCWLKLSCGRHLPAGLPDSPLVAAALEGLKVDGTFHAAVDAVSGRG